MEITPHNTDSTVQIMSSMFVCLDIISSHPKLVSQANLTFKQDIINNILNMDYVQLRQRYPIKLDPKTDVTLQKKFALAKKLSAEQQALSLELLASMYNCQPQFLKDLKQIAAKQKAITNSATNNLLHAVIVEIAAEYNFDLGSPKPKTPMRPKPSANTKKPEKHKHYGYCPYGCF